MMDVVNDLHMESPATTNLGGSTSAVNVNSRPMKKKSTRNERRRKLKSSLKADVVNDLHMESPATTNLGGSASAADVNSSQKQKKGRNRKRRRPNYSLKADVVNDLHMESPATTNLGGSASAADVNSPQKLKKERNRKRRKPNYSLKADATIKPSLHESSALPNFSSYQIVVEYNSTNNEKGQQQKTTHDALEGNLNGCDTPDNICSRKASTTALDMPSEHPIQCFSTDPITSQSCVEVGIFQGHDEENEQTMINTTAENSNSQHGIPEESCNHISIAARPEPLAKEYVSESEAVKLNTEHGINDNISNPEDKNGFVNNTTLVKKNVDDSTDYGLSDKNLCVKTYARRKLVNFSCSRNSGTSSPENCNMEPTIQDHHKDDSHKLSDGLLKVGLMDGETRLSNGQVTSRSGAAAEEVKLRANNINEQKLMTTSSVVDIPLEHLVTDGRQLDNMETIDDLCFEDDDFSDSSLDTVSDGCLKISRFPLEINFAGHSKNKLLILDLNGLLADIIPKKKKRDYLGGRKVYKRPYCDDFLQFCFDRFHVGVWSSRMKENVNEAIKCLIGESASKLLFSWSRKQCTKTRFKTIEDAHKPLVLKEIRKLWEKEEKDLPWEKGVFNETNTLLLDDSPYKALLNPMHTGIFPYSYHYYDTEDRDLGPGGDLRVYLERLAEAENVQNYVSENPFGQRPITETNPSWRFYRKVINSLKESQNAGTSSRR